MRAEHWELAWRQRPTRVQSAGPGGSVNPYSSAQDHSPPPQRSNSKTLLWVLLGMGGGVLLACCGCVGFGWLFWTGATSVVADQVKVQIQNDPIVQEHLGEVQKVSLNMQRSMEESGRRKTAGNVMAFDVQGTKGKGVITGVQDPQPDEGKVLTDIDLVLPDGQAIPLDGE